jgi:hypothetical protein
MTAPLLSIRDREIKDSMNVVISDVEFKEYSPAEDDRVWICIKAIMTIPNYTTDENDLEYDNNHLPIKQSDKDYPLVILVPESLRGETSSSNPSSVLVFGHGLFVSAQGYISPDGSMSDPVIDLVNQMKVVAVGTDWSGLCSNDLSIALTSITNISKVQTITDRLLQGALNVMTAARYIKKPDGLSTLEYLTTSHASEDIYINPDNVFYSGISLGGIMGTTFMSINPDIKTGVLHVPGGIWSIMLRRSADFSIVSGAFEAGLTGALDQQLAVSIIQSFFDFTDPIVWARYINNNPITPLGTKNALWQEALWDSEVPNITTETIMRSIDVPLITPSVKSVYGLDEVSLPYTGSGLMIWEDKDYGFNDNGNTPGDDGSHKAIRPLQVWRDQTEHYLKSDGEVLDYCNGPCSFE